MITPLGKPVASGRSADLFALGDDQLIRVRRDGDIASNEPIAMRLAERAGFPVPHVHSVEGRKMVLDRIDGRDMLDLLGDRPWRVLKYARTLADLHLRLRAIVPDDPGLSGDEPREALVHGDLHPGNVLMAADGPVVIDWENARAGPADLDAAITWLLLTVGDPDDASAVLRLMVRLLRGVLIRTFLAGVGRPSTAAVDLTCELRLDDQNMSPAERDRIREFRTHHGQA